MQKEYIEKQKVVELLNRFDSFISSITRTATDEHVAIYEHWIDCNYDIKVLPTVTEQEITARRGLKVKKNSNRCSCYRNDGRCNGTGKIDICNCNGDEGKCDFYPEKRVNNAEYESYRDGQNKGMSDARYCTAREFAKKLEEKIKSMRFNASYEENNAFHYTQDKCIGFIDELLKEMVYDNNMSKTLENRNRKKRMRKKL